MEHIIVKTANNETRIRLYGSSSPVKVSKGEQRKKLLGEDVVDLSIETSKPIPFVVGDWLEVFGEKYWLNLMPKAKKAGRKSFTYDLTFEGVQYLLSKVVFLDEDKSGKSTSGTFTLRANLEEIAGIVINNLVRVYGAGSWIIGTLPAQTTDVRDFSFTDNNCLAVVQQICNEYGIEFNITKSGNAYALNFKKLGQIIPYTLKYGRGNGLYTLDRENVSSSNIITRLYAYGSDKNLPSNYRNYSTRLRLAANAQSYIENAKAVTAFGIIEGSKTFDEVYPHRTGTVSAIVTGNILSFIDSSIDYDLNSYLISGTSAKVTFNSGGLSGYTFELSSFDFASKTFKILSYTDDRNNVFPSSSAATFQIGVGDTYVITDVYPTQSQIDTAEAELATKAQEYLSQNCAPKVKYGATISEDFLSKLAGSGATVNIFNLGDALGIIDDDVNVSRTGADSIRITSLTRSLIAKTSYSYTLDVSDTVEVNVIDRVISDQQETNKIIRINNLTDVSRLKRSWRTTQELLTMIFDQDGYFKDGNIRPNSIETQMLSVGAKAQQFVLKNLIIEPNYNGNPNSINVSSGVLVHYGIFSGINTWNLSAASQTLANTGAYYIYCRANKADSGAIILFDQTQHSVEEGSYYYFMIGVLHSVDTNNTRWISLTYGASSVNGRFIKTGRIISADGNTWFDLDTGEIHGKITFGSNNTTLEEVDQKASDANNYVTNTLPGILEGIQAQLDGQIEQFFYTYDPTTTNVPASDWTTTVLQEAHLGDLFYNTTTGKVFRWIKNGTVYSWQELQDSEVAQALALANDALALAKTKRRVFTVQPTTPYEVADLWVQGSTGDIMKCTTARASGSYVASDWEKASKYTDDSALTTFVNGLFSTTVSDLTTQIDGKIENYFTASDPATAWADDTTKAKHVGDFWYNTTGKQLKRYTFANSAYTWELIEDAAAIAAAEAASKAQDTADGKRTVFLVQPTTPYYAGDLWTDGSFLKRCITTRESGSYVASDWGLATNYDNTKTTIDGGIVTSGTVQLAGDSGSILAGITGQGTAETSVRIWAGATFDSRASAPFRVQQNGEVFARYRIELQDNQLNGLAGICGQGTDGTDNGIRFWAGSTFANRVSAPFRVDKDGACVMEKATINNGCTIGSWEVSNGGIFNDSGEAYLIARKAFGDGNYCEARIGTNVFPSSSGVTGAAYFENTQSNTFGTNIGFAVDVRNADSNIACAMYGGHVSGLAVRPLSVLYTQSIPRGVNAIFCTNTAEITITLPVLEQKDDGYIMWIKNINGSNVLIKPGSYYQPIHADRGTLYTTSNPNSLQSIGDAMAYIFKWGLKRSGYADTGFWVQFKNPCNW